MRNRWKKIALSAVSVALATSLYMPSASAKGNLIDVSGRLKGEVEEAYKIGLIDGYSDGSFKPTQPMTRGAFAKLIVTTYEVITGETLSSPNGSTFTDISKTTFEHYILKATEAGWIHGYPNSTYQPNEPISREQAAKIIASVAKLELIAEPFTDVADKSVFAPFIGATQASGLMYGYNETLFKPQEIISREQAAAIVLRLYKHLDDTINYFEIEEATILDMQEAMEEGKVTSEELVTFYLDRIENYDDNINSILHINEDALTVAQALDQEREDGKVRGDLHGIPVLLKDNYDTKDMPTTAGSLSLEGSIPQDDAYQTKRLREEGAIILGKANLHEFAFGFETISSLGGQTHNPYDLTKYAGGSSGGTGAAIASNFAAAGLGTDTGGSIRVPASFNNLVGIRPTMGLASRDGIIPLALTQDVGGPMARTVEDVAIMLDAIAGYDPADPVTKTSEGQIPDSYTDYLDENGLKGAKIGVVTALYGEDEQIIQAMNEAIVDMEKLGAEIIEVTIPNLEQILAYPSLSSFEFKFQLNDYLTSLGPNAPVKSLTEIIESKKYHPSLENSLISRNNRVSLEDPDYLQIITTRPTLTKESLITVFNANQLDALIYPASTQLPSTIGESQGAGTNNRLSPFSGYPAMSIPMGFSDTGLPIGMEMLGKEFNEATLIKLAYSYQEGTNHRQAPELQ